MKAEFTVLTSLGGVCGPPAAARTWWLKPPDQEVLKHFINFEEFI
jgi:hypothetical protein